MLRTHPFLFSMKFLLLIHLALHNSKPTNTTISDTIYLAHFHSYKKRNTNVFLLISTSSPLWILTKKSQAKRSWVILKSVPPAQARPGEYPDTHHQKGEALAYAGTGEFPGA